MELKPPAQSDRRYGLGKSVEVLASMIPVVGGPLQIIVGETLARPQIRRMEEWLTELAVSLRTLEYRVGSFETLAENEAFVDALGAGVRIAARSRQDKRKALRNAVLNTALAVDPNEDRQHIFFDLIDRFPPLSLRLLKFLADRKYREDVGYVAPASGSDRVAVADISKLLSPTPSGDGWNGNMAALFDRECVRLRRKD
jgi:hypothetical protein